MADKQNLKRDHRVPGKVYDQTEAEKAARIKMSASWLQKDRLKEEPEIDFARYGRAIRYSRG